MKSNPQLIGYCGLYCGACGIYQGKIKQAVENLRRVISAYGFDKITDDLAKWEPSFKHYSEFEKVMDGWVKMFGGCPGCVGGGGDPTCAVRECAKQKKHAICAECAEIEDCGKLKEPELKTLREIKAQGVSKWAEDIQRRVESGYCYLDERMK